MRIYTRLRKRCRVKSINDGQCDTMELWEDGRGTFVTRFRFLIFKIFSFQDEEYSLRIEKLFTLPRAPLGRSVNDLRFLPDNVFFNWVYRH